MKLCVMQAKSDLYINGGIVKGNVVVFINGSIGRIHIENVV